MKTWTNSLQVFYTASMACIIFVVSYVFLAEIGVIFQFETGEEIGEVSGWCERVSGGIFREPVNTLSNISFMISGLIMLRILSNEKLSANSFFGINKISCLYALVVIYLGPGSWLMHGTHTPWGGWADNQSMIMYIIFPWLYNLKEMGRWSEQRFLSIYFLIVILYSLARWFLGGRLGIGLDLFGLSIALWVISETLYKFWSPTFRWLSGFVGFAVASIFGIFPNEILTNPHEYWWVILFWIPSIFAGNAPSSSRVHTPWFFAGMLIFLAAFIVWLQGYPDQYLCRPDSWIQPHAIWHMMTALSTWCFFKFFRTEARVNEDALR